MQPIALIKEDLKRHHPLKLQSRVRRQVFYHTGYGIILFIINLNAFTNYILLVAKKFLCRLFGDDKGAVLFKRRYRLTLYKVQRKHAEQRWIGINARCKNRIIALAE